MEEVNQRELVRLTGLFRRRNKSGVEYFAGRISQTATLFIFPARDKRVGKPEMIAYFGETSAEDLESETKPGVENLSGDPT